MNITGVVTDSQGESVIGASVRIKDTTNGVITDMDGRYTITAPGKNSILVISYIGYSTEEVKINDRRNINIRLQRRHKSTG